MVSQILQDVSTLQIPALKEVNSYLRYQRITKEILSTEWKTLEPCVLMYGVVSTLHYPDRSVITKIHFKEQAREQ